MKKYYQIALVALVCLFSFQVTACADNDKLIDFNQLPATAQQLVKKYFPTQKVAATTVESGLLQKSYDVVFASTDKIEFDSKGNWTEIRCRKSAVPTALVPAAITNYVKNTYEGSTILSIEKERNEYEIHLANGLEITFNSKFQVIDID